MPCQISRLVPYASLRPCVPASLRPVVVRLFAPSVFGHKTQYTANNLILLIICHVAPRRQAQTLFE